MNTRSECGELLLSCRDGNIQNVKKELLRLKLPVDDKVLSICFNYVFNYNHIDVLKELMNYLYVNYEKDPYRTQWNPKWSKEEQISFEKKYFVDNYMKNIFKIFNNAICAKGYIGMIKYLEKNVSSILSSLYDYKISIASACNNNQLELVQYLIEQSESKINLKYIKQYGDFLYDSVSNGENEIIYYFLKNKLLNKKINYTGLLTNAYYSKNMELVNYIIFDHNIAFSKVKKKIVSNPELQELEDLFNGRVIKKRKEKLDKNLKINNSKPEKRIKL